MLETKVVSPARPRVFARTHAVVSGPRRRVTFVSRGLTMQTITLTQEQVAFVDDEDYERVYKFKWYAHWRRDAKTYYARRADYSNDGRRKTVYLHRFIMGLKSGRSPQIDHEDHNGLNCQKHNMRVCTPAQNMLNRRKMKHSQWPYKGIERTSGGGRGGHCWRARVRLHGITTTIGYFRTPEQAYAAYCEVVKKLHGEFSCFG